MKTCLPSSITTSSGSIFVLESKFQAIKQCLVRANGFKGIADSTVDRLIGDIDTMIECIEKSKEKES